MILGLLTDIHEDVRSLRLALGRFRQVGVDRVVLLGDVFETGRALVGAVDLLIESGAVGVWGNHDFGLCRDPHPEVRARFPGHVMAYMATLQPRLVIDDCLFTHVEPWLDPESLVDLWHFDGSPGDPEDLSACFASAPQRVLFSGHIHRWSLWTPAGRMAWDCLTPVRLEPPGRFMVVLGALCDGRCATYDTSTGLLTPIDLRDGPPPANGDRAPVGESTDQDMAD